MNIVERAELAVKLKSTGYNCCQAVVAALSDLVDCDVDTLNAAAAGFCVGMGDMTATCGALIGAGIIAGLLTRGNGTVRYTRAISEEFRTLCGATYCHELKSIKDGRPLCPCSECVRNGVLAFGKVFDMQ